MKSQVQVIPNMPETEYHAIKDRLSSTMIKKLLQSPAHLKSYLSQPQRTTDSMSRGSRIHSAILEPRSLKTRYAIEPTLEQHKGALVTGDQLRTRCKELELPVSGKNADLAARILDKDPKAIIWDRVMEKFEAANKGKIAISAEELKQMEAITENVFSRDAASEALQGEAEITVLWTDPETGVRCKCRIDKYNCKTGILCDVKTSEADEASPEGFSRYMANWDVDVQMAFYSHGVVAAGLPFQACRIVMVECKDPFGIGVYGIHARAWKSGFDQVRRGIQLYADCLKSGLWPSYRDEVLVVDKPNWAYHETPTFQVG